ncbi:hypothetical protein CPB86DRAFT_76503 [Serendipita vermifera]|nr:hypothetical protein CPB86DRAFT_76503 [Serendipita vermifera]
MLAVTPQGLDSATSELARYIGMGILAGNVPGGVLKTVAQENAYLEQFVNLLKQRAELDRRYFEDLQSLNEFVNPEWSKSDIWTLVEPLLDFFSKEVVQRRETYASITARISQLGKLGSVDLPDDSGMSQYAELDTVLQEYESRRLDAASPSSVAELKAWHEYKYDFSFTVNLGARDFPSFSLPPRGE